MGNNDWLEKPYLYGGTKEISNIEYKNLKKIEKNYERINDDLIEYMGYSEEFLRSDKWLMKHNKKDLMDKIHKQRCVIRKLISELEPSRRDTYLEYLNKLERELE